MPDVKRWATRRVKPLRQRQSRLRRWNHKRQNHLVVKTVMRDVTVFDGEFSFYWRRGWHCANCTIDWPTYT
jgi:hypothetical protein